MRNHFLADVQTLSRPRDSDADGAIAGQDPTVLDNPIWNSLRTEHAPLAIGDEQARRFPAAVGPLSGMPDQSPESYAALAPLAGPGGVVALFFTEPPSAPSGWTLVRGGMLAQMVADNPEETEGGPLAARVQLRCLTAADVPAMVALAELTEPGPFRQRTIELGAFFGIFESDRLVAMAGQRLHLPGFVEVSAVCTHPDARGRGYARTLIAAVTREIRQRGKTPFLHSFTDNDAAIRVYEGLGFTLRRQLHLAMLRHDG
jgi:GNAT superfamily N-acetyltransferase